MTTKQKMLLVSSMIAQMIADCQKWILFVCISLMFIEASKWTWSFSPSAQHQWGTVQNQKLYYTQSTRPWEKNGLDWENSRITLNQYEWAQLFKKSHQHWKSGTFIAGCNCHLAHLAACKGREGYCSATSFDIKEHQIDLLYFFKNSTRRKCILAKYLHQPDVFN